MRAWSPTGTAVWTLAVPAFSPIFHVCWCTPPHCAVSSSVHFASFDSSIQLRGSCRLMKPVASTQSHTYSEMRAISSLDAIERLTKKPFARKNSASSGDTVGSSQPGSRSKYGRGSADNGHG